jgi:hypothetical protein
VTVAIIASVWFLLYVTCRLFTCEFCPDGCKKVSKTLCCANVSDQGYSSFAIMWPKMVILIVLIAMLVTCVAGFTYSEIWSEFFKTFFDDYATSVSDQTEDVAFVVTKLTAEGDAGAKIGDSLSVKMKPNLEAQGKTVKEVKEFEGSR